MLKDNHIKAILSADEKGWIIPQNNLAMHNACGALVFKKYVKEIGKRTVMVPREFLVYQLTETGKEIFDMLNQKGGDR